MANNQNNQIERVSSFLEQNTRGNQIGIYTVAGLGLAFALHKIRPISKFSRARDVPKHFIKNRELLRGRVIDCEPSVHGPRLLFEHKPLVKIPLWHANKPPIPVQVWGVKLVGGNGFSWLQVVAVGREVTITPIKVSNDALVAHVTIHWPITPSVSSTIVEKNAKSKNLSAVEDIEVGEKLIEYGMGRVSEDVAQVPRGAFNWWTPWTMDKGNSEGYLLQRAQDQARNSRTGFWQDVIPAPRFSKILALIKSYLPKKNNKAAAVSAA